jgi:hypothetical protein
MSEFNHIIFEFKMHPTNECQSDILLYFTIVQADIRVNFYYLYNIL